MGRDRNLSPAVPSLVRHVVVLRRTWVVISRELHSGGVTSDLATAHPSRLLRPQPGSQPLAKMRKRLTQGAGVSPWWGAGAVGRQARSARVGTRHSHAVPSLGRRVGHCAASRHPAHRGRRRHRAARLKSGKLCCVQGIGRIISLHIWEPARMMRRYLAVCAGVRVMVLWWCC